MSNILRCDFEYLGVSEGIVYIRDLNLGRMSVTNDAEMVLDVVRFKYGSDVRVVYQDSNGDWTEIIHNPDQDMFGPEITFKPWHGLAWDILATK